MRDRSGQQVGNYHLVRLLGQGSFAEVYLAEHIYLKTQVAVKLLHTHLTEHEFISFLNEAQTIARLKHPHIISVLDFGIDGTPYLVMDYVPNGSLRQLYPRGSTMLDPTRLDDVLAPIMRLISYVNQIAAALQYAHDNKVIHCDVKPENMLISSDNRVVLSDFGIATIAHQTSSLKTVNASGTPVYMAPEQIAGKPRPASDQYALGVVIYEWICGSPPFHGEPLAVMYQHTYAPVPPIPESKVMAEVRQIVLQALAKNPEDRFVSVQAFASALEFPVFLTAVEKDLLKWILREMKNRRMPISQARQISLDFLALKPLQMKNKEELFKGLEELKKTHKIVEQTYLVASNGLLAILNSWDELRTQENEIEGKNQKHI